MEYLLIPVALFLAFGNGANDNFKGFATVWGSDTLSYRSALLLATIATIAGSMLSLFLAEGLAQQFSGKGLLPNAVVNAPSFMLSVGMGAALTVILASRAGLPISTTHVSVGSIAGVGASASTLDWHTLRNVLLSWVATLPMAASVAWVAQKCCDGVARWPL